MEYFLFPEFNKKLNDVSFQVLESCDFHGDKHWNFSNEYANYSKLFYFYEGSGYIIYNGEKIEMISGNVYFLPAGISYGFLCLSSMKKVYHFVQALMIDGTDLFEQVHEVIQMPYSVEKIKEMIALMEEGSIASAYAYNVQMYVTMAQVIKITQEKGYELTIPEYPNHILKMLRYIDYNLSAQLRVADCAKYMNVTPTTLTKQFQKHIGKTPKSFISAALLRKSKQLLLEGYKVKEVSEELSFCDPYHFSRFFTQYVSFSPREFQKRNNGNLRYRYWDEHSTRKQSF